MKRKTTLAAAIGAALVPWPVVAQTLVITQTGEGNTVQVSQPGAIGATATIAQDALGAAASIEQRGAAHDARIAQTADRYGVARIGQDGGAPARALIDQTQTVWSTAEIRQVAGSDLEASVAQTRSSLAVAVVQQSVSTGSRAEVLQSDSATVDARVTQTQSSAQIEIVQRTSQASFASVEQTSSRADARISQIDESRSSATVVQTHSDGGARATLLLSGNLSTSAQATQRGVMGDSVLIEQSGNAQTLAVVEQEGRSSSGPQGAAVTQTGNRTTTARVSQAGGITSANLVQAYNVGVNAEIHQASAWMPEAAIEQTANVAVDSIARITQIGGTGDVAGIVQRGNRAPTLRAGVVQSSAESGGATWITGTFVPGYFEAISHRGGGSGNRMTTVLVQQTDSAGDRAEAGVAMLGSESSAASVIQNRNDGDVLALHRMVTARNASGSILQESNASGTRVSAEIAQNGSGGAAVSLTQRANVAGSVWMRAEQSDVQGTTANGLQTGSASVFGLITQQLGSTDSTATLEQRGVTRGSAWVLQGTDDMGRGIVVPGHATALIALLNPDPGPNRGAAIASSASVLQTDGTDLAARIVQTGTGLSGRIVQDGAWKEASLIQNGTGHVASIVQGGVQIGSHPSGVDLRQLGATPQSATITQTAAGSRIAVLQQ